MRKRNRISKKILNTTDFQKTKLDSEISPIEDSLLRSHHEEEIARESRAIATIKIKKSKVILHQYNPNKSDLQDQIMILKVSSSRSSPSLINRWDRAKHLLLVNDILNDLKQKSESKTEEIIHTRHPSFHRSFLTHLPDLSHL